MGNNGKMTEINQNHWNNFMKLHNLIYSMAFCTEITRRNHEENLKWLTFRIYA